MRRTRTPVPAEADCAGSTIQLPGTCGKCRPHAYPCEHRIAVVRGFVAQTYL
ncbi:hypothetical protein V8P53_03240 [Acinetobacter baumannii]